MHAIQNLMPTSGREAKNTYRKYDNIQEFNKYPSNLTYLS